MQVVYGEELSGGGEGGQQVGKRKQLSKDADSAGVWLLPDSTGTSGERTALQSPSHLEARKPACFIFGNVSAWRHQLPERGLPFGCGQFPRAGGSYDLLAVNIDCSREGSAAGGKGHAGGHRQDAL